MDDLNLLPTGGGVYEHIFRGQGVVDGEGGSSERCLKWGGGGVIKGLSKNILKQGWVKAKVVRRGEGVLKCHHPCPPENFSYTRGFPYHHSVNCHS